MICHIDATNGVPIYEHIGPQVTYAIANGSLLVGEHVPSVRELATQLAVNPNTVARAYRELQQTGILTPIRGTGLAVAPTAPDQCREGRRHILQDRVESVVREAQQGGLQLDDFLKLVHAAWPTSA